MGSYAQALEYKQALNHREFLEQHDNLVKQRDTILNNLPNLQGTPDYDKAVGALTSAEKAIREHWRPDNTPPGMIAKFGHKLTDAMRLTSPEKRDVQAKAKTAAGDKRDAESTQRDIAAAPMSLEQQARIKSKAAAVGSTEEFNNANEVWDKDNPNATLEQKTKAHYENFQRIMLGITGSEAAARIAANKPDIQSLTLTNGKKTAAQWNPEKGWTYLSGESIPPELIGSGATIDPKPAAPIKGPMVRVNKKQSYTGFAQLYLDKYDPNKVVGWQPITPSSRYMGSVTGDISIDAYGVMTKSTRTTTPLGQQEVDLTNILKSRFPDDYEGSEGAGAITEQPGAPATPGAGPQAGSPKAKPSAKTPVVPSGAPPAAPAKLTDPLAPAPEESKLDKDGHIPDSAPGNTSLKASANQLLDGMDVDKLPIPSKDRGAAMQLAGQYGWKQGLFTPKEKLLLREARTYLNRALNDPSLKVLNSKLSRSKIMNALHATRPTAGIVPQLVAVNWTPNPQEAAFIRMYNQLSGTITGLGQLTRGGRTTEAQVNRVLSELPNVIQSSNETDGKERLKRLLDEIDVAMKDVMGVGLMDSGGGEHKTQTPQEAEESLRKRMRDAVTQQK